MKQLEELDGCDCSATLRLTHGRGLMAWVNARVVFTYGLQRVSGVTASTSIDGDRGMDVDDGDSDAGASELECSTGSGRMRSGLIRHHVEKDRSCFSALQENGLTFCREEISVNRGTLSPRRLEEIPALINHVTS